MPPRVKGAGAALGLLPIEALLQGPPGAVVLVQRRRQVV
jgi:hypothetical protein